jgi:hypothetical protein
VIVEPEDIFGDGVNIAARREALSEPGGICIPSATTLARGSYLRSKTRGSKASRTLLALCTSIAFGLTPGPKSYRLERPTQCKTRRCPSPTSPRLRAAPYQHERRSRTGVLR